MSAEVMPFPVPELSDLGELAQANLRAYIAVRRVPQEALAERLGMSQQAVSDRVRGRVKLTVADLGRFAVALGVEPGDLLSATPRWAPWGSNPEPAD